MSRKVLRKTRTGQWVVAAIALLAVGGAAASAIPSSQETTVSNSGSSTISSKDKTSESSSTSDKTTDTKTATETSGDSVSDAAKEVVENVAAAIAAVNNSQDNTTPVAAAIAEAPKPVIPAGQDTPATQPVQPSKPSDGRVAELPEVPADLINKIKPAEKPVEPAKPVETPKAETPAKPETPAETPKPETPAKPAKPAKPVETPKAETPAKPETPAETPKPETPAKPAKPAKPVETPKAETPAKPETPAETPKPETPAKPAKPVETPKAETPAKPETPAETPKPETPAKPAKPAKPVETPKAETPAKPETPAETPKPETPAKPAKPVETPKAETPAKPETPAETPKPETPAKPAKPVETPKAETPAKPETPAETPKPETPAKPAKPVETPKAETPAKPETPAETPKPETPAKPVETPKAETPAKPETPAETPKPETPAKPVETPKAETPAKPETPAETPKPETPAKPVETPKAETPAKPETPAETPKPETPAKPAKPVETPKAETPAKPETPAETPKPETPAKPAKPVETPKAETPAKPETPAETPKPETPAKPVETPKAPKDTTTVVSKDEKPAAIPDPEVKPGGEVIGSEDTKTSDKTVTGEKPATPVDTPATPGGTDTNVTPGDTVITKPEVPATPAVPGTDEVKDDQGNVVTPGTPATPAVPAQPAETKRTDVVVDVTTINYGTTYVKDTTLKSGETKLITPGVNGTTTVTTNVDYINDVEVGRTVVSSVTVDPINEVIAYNDEPEVLREEVIETLNTIAYGTERRATTDLEEGQERVVTKGVNGQTKTTTKHVYDANGNLVASEDLGTVTVTEAVNEVIEYGVRAKDVIEVVEERTSTELDYQTETRETDQLYKGETRVVTKGIKGYVVNVAKVTKTNGVETAREVTEGERVDPVTEVIEVGTKDRVEVTSATRTEAIDFQTETRQNDQLDKGETRVITQGVKGQRVIKTTTTTTNGVPVTTEEVVSETAPVTHVVEVGTREKTETSTRQVVEEIDFQTITRQNPDLKKGEQRIVTQGVKGRKVTEITTITVGGTTIEDSKVIENTAPVNQVIEVGTKEDIRYDMRVEREEIAFKTVTRHTDALFEGETREVTPGTNGRKATTYRDTYVDGVKVGSEIVGEPVVVEAVDRVIEVGTRKEQTTASVTNTEVLNFTTVTENDPNLEVGQTRIRVNGVNGQRVVRITRVTNNRTGEVTETREVISETAPVNEVLVVGTKPASDSLLDKKTLTLDEFMSLTEEQQDAFIAKKGTVPGTTIRTGATKDTLEKVEQLINLDKLNAEFVNLLNAARAAEGLSAVTYAGQGSDVQSAATARANEMADHGSLRYQGTPDGAHKRPDGSNWTTIYTAEQTARQGWRGENALQLGSALSAYSAIDESSIANSLFNEWMNSSGHKAVMMKNLDNLQVAVGIGLNDKAIETTFRNGVTVAMLELVQPKP